MKKNFDTLIIGAGFAGLATAYFLLKKKAGSVCIVEKESAPGLAASGRNASMICQIVRDTTLCKLMLESTRIIKREWLEQFPSVSFQRCGSLHIGTTENMDSLGPSCHIAKADFGVDTERREKEEVLNWFPFLENTAFNEALLCYSDGVIDIKNLILNLTDYCKSKGAVFLTSTEAKPKKEGDIFQVETTSGETVEGNVLVNAAGAWIGEVATSVGAQELAVNPLKRHIFVSEKNPFEESVQDWPIVWNMQDEAYFRPDGDSLQFSPCDEIPHPAGYTDVDLKAEKDLRKKIKNFLPSAEPLSFPTSWSGLRTFSKDRKFIIGWDDQVENFLWVGCLGGYGLTSSAAVGRVASSLILDEPVEEEFEVGLSPKRFLKKKEKVS